MGGIRGVWGIGLPQQLLAEEYTTAHSTRSMCGMRAGVYCYARWHSYFISAVDTQVAVSWPRRPIYRVSGWTHDLQCTVQPATTQPALVTCAACMKVMRTMPRGGGGPSGSPVVYSPPVTTPAQACSAADLDRQAGVHLPQHRAGCLHPRLSWGVADRHV